MDSRMQTLWSHASVVVEGTAIGVLGRYIFLGPENICTLKADPANKLSYAQLTAETFKPRNFYRLNKIFFNSMLLQTVGKSLSSMGAMHYTRVHYSHLSPSEKTLMVTMLGWPLETFTTGYDEWKRTLAMRQIKRQCSPLSVDFARTLGGTGFRIGVTALTTYYAIFKATEQGHRLFPNANYIKVETASTAVGAFLVQYINMPFINFQNWVFTNAEKPFKEAVTSFSKLPFKQLWNAANIRGAWRLGFYSLTAAASAAAKERREAHSKELGEPKVLKKG